VPQLLFKRTQLNGVQGLHSTSVRSDLENVDYAIFYNPTTKELTYADANAAGGSGSAAQPTTRGSVYGLTDLNNTGVGRSVFASVDTGNGNSAFGKNALTALTGGEGNTAIGDGAAILLTTGTNNTIVGSGAGSALLSGDENTLIGLNAGNNLTTGSTNIVIGRNATASSATVANEVTLGGINITNTRLRGAISVGNLTPSAGTAGQVLTSQGSSSAPVWGAPTTQIQPDWNAVSGLGSILNKPTIPAAQVQTDWNATSGLGVLLNKPTVFTSTFIGTTSLAFNRSSGSQTLSGVSISGNAGTVTNGVYINGSYSDPTWLTALSTDKLGQGTATDGQVLSWSTSGNKWQPANPANLPFLTYIKTSDQSVTTSIRCSFSSTVVNGGGVAFGSMASNGVFTFSVAGSYMVTISFNVSANPDAWGRVDSTDTPRYTQWSIGSTGAQKGSISEVVTVTAGQTFDWWISSICTVFGTGDTRTRISFVKLA